MPAATSAEHGPPPRPHIVYILSDNLGYGDVGYLRATSPAGPSSAVQTPQIDALAATGIILSSFYTWKVRGCSGPSSKVTLPCAFLELRVVGVQEPRPWNVPMWALAMNAFPTTYEYTPAGYSSVARPDRHFFQGATRSLSTSTMI
jgi:hypothetical protein